MIVPCIISINCYTDLFTCKSEILKDSLFKLEVILQDILPLVVAVYHMIRKVHFITVMHWHFISRKFIYWILENRVNHEHCFDLSFYSVYTILTRRKSNAESQSQDVNSENIQEPAIYENSEIKNGHIQDSAMKIPSTQNENFQNTGKNGRILEPVV